jgi:hydrogenase nickel incorporation protein HypA/HybF
MHEMGIAMQILDIARESIPEDAKDARVTQVNLRVGRLAAVVPDSLRFCFDVLTKRTAFEGSRLHIDEIPVVALCQKCNARWEVESPVFICDTCGGGDLTLLSGQELEIASIEIDDDPNTEDTTNGN